jgi:heptosyltransferase-2
MMKIVIRVPNWIGDAILALPAISSLRENFPDARVWIAARDWVEDLFPADDFIQGTIPLPKLADLKSLRLSSQKLKDFNFDVGLLLANSFSSAFLFYLTRIPERWGYSSDGRSLLLTKSVPLKNKDHSDHQVNYYLNLISGLGLKTIPPEIKLSLSQEERVAAREMLLSSGLDTAKLLVILAPGAYYGPAKRWPAPKFAELARMFQIKANAEIIIIGAQGEIDIARSIAALMEKEPWILAGKTTLRQLLGLISQAALFVTNDSGPMHIANALKIPVVAIFGPTDPRVTGPFQQPSAVIKKDVPCWPCLYRSCPYDHRCMMKIEPEEVFEASYAFLK